jgi:hypothetical protein
MLEVCLHDEATPYVFESSSQAWDLFRGELNSRLGVSHRDVRVVGSGRFGFSLTPGRDLSRFRDDSDIDVVVVNDGLFDELWLALLRAAYPRWPITGQIGPWLEERRAEVYTGFLTPLAVKLDIRIVGAKGRPVLDFTTRWFNAFKEAARHPTRRHADVTGRIYRTWQHADLYHLSSLRSLRQTLAK